MLKIKRNNTPIKTEELKQSKLTQKLSYIILDLLCSYIISDNKNIRLKGYNNIKTLLDLMNLNDYREEADIERIDFIRFGLDARIKFGLITGEQVKDYIVSNDVTHAGNYNINLQELSNSDVEYVNNTVSNLLDSAEYTNYIHIFDGLSKEFDNANAYRRQEIIERWKEYIAACNTKIREHKIDKSEEEFVSLREGIFEDYAKDTHAYMSNSSSKLSTGMVGLNHLLGGGFENGRVYSLFGLQGEGKSTTLLNIGYQMKTFNTKYKTKDPTKKPAIVYLTLENTKRESFSRLFSITTNAGSIIDYDSDEGIAMMRNSGAVVNEDNPIDLVIKYKPNNTVSTTYLYELADELAEYNYEVIAFIVDYINVIKSVVDYKAGEERLRLGAVINEFKAIAASMDIPIITAGQMNREANKNVDAAREKGEYNMHKYVDRSNLGESMLILNNLDGAFIITPVIVGTTEKYLTFKMIKARYTPNRNELGFKDYIYHPYETVDGITLKCDVKEDKPLFLFDLSYKKVDCEVDKDVEIPDNSSRFNDNVNTKPAVLNSKIVLYEDGTKLEYNPEWMNQPKEIDGIVNMSAWDVEKQFRFNRNKKTFGNVLNSKINSLNGYSRYSDAYTKLYNPDGSKEERLAHDYSIRYNREFTPEDFPKLYDHFIKLKNGELNSTNTEFEETEIKYVPEDEGMFVEIPPVDREAILNHFSYLASVKS